MKKIPSIFIASLYKSVNLILQTATFTHFSCPFPTKPKNNENREIVFSSSFVQPRFFKEKVKSSA